MELGGKTLSIETGKMAHQANGACIVRYGDTVVLVTAVMAAFAGEDRGYFPLMVEYEERMYAAGKIKGSRFIKREGRPTDEAMISARMIDRGLRPLFNDAIRRDIQVISTVLSIDDDNDPDVVSYIGAACAIMISDIPFAGPLGAIRVGRIGGEWVINPSYEARTKCALDFVVAGTADKVLMLEAEAKEVNEDAAYEAIVFAQKHLGKICGFLASIQKEIGLEKNTSVINESAKSEEGESEEGKQKKELAAKIVREEVEKRVEAIFDTTLQTKTERKAAIDSMKAAIEERLVAEQIGKDKRAEALTAVDALVEDHITANIIERERRVDGRKLDEIRALAAEVGLLPRTHGSGLFSRGETQVLSVVTLGAPGDEQILDTMEEDDTKKRYMHHYNFPPYSVGEAKMMRGTSRREVGHGMLAEKALLPVLPDKETFPYTIRVVSETMGSNGSSSMGSVCGSTLSLMDTGVPITRPVAGIAMGIASQADEKGDITAYAVLTDLQDFEDGKGGMDFKIAGTGTGITAIQLDTKTKGITQEIIRETLDRAKTARLQILEVITKAIPEPRKEMSPFAPRVQTLKIAVDKIRDVIGPGGKVINEIIDTCDVTIDIEQDGTVFIAGVGEEGMRKAIAWIESLTEEPEVGKVYEGKVSRIMDFGAFVEIIPGKDAMVHVSKLCKVRVNQVTDVLHVDDVVKVKLVEIDDQGRLNASLTDVEGNDELYCKNLPASSPAPHYGDRPRFDRHGGDSRQPRKPFGRRPR